MSICTIVVKLVFDQMHTEIVSIDRLLASPRSSIVIHSVFSCQIYRVEEYILISKERFGYSSEQALGLLLWHRYDYETALSDLGNFEPLQEEWTTEEKVLFEQAFK